MTQPRVDVGVVTFNTAELAVTALRRLLDVDQGVDVRLLVRDNGSSDGTADAIARSVPEAELDAGLDNLGFAAGVNRLIEKSDAPWFLALNSDAWPEPGALTTLVRAAEAHPEAAAVAPRLLRPDGTLEQSTHPFPSLTVATLTGLGLTRVIGGRKARAMLLEPAWSCDEARPVDWAVGAALLMRRDALDDVGGFDERFFMYVEDLDWCWRARQRGWEVRIEPDAVVRHVGNASGESAYGRERSAVYLRNTYRFYRRHHGRLSTATFRLLNLVGGMRLYAQFRLRHEPAVADYWRAQLRAHVAPIGGVDGPPAPR